MRVKRSEAYKTRVETHRQRTHMATAFSNILDNTSSSIYADTDTLRDAEHQKQKEVFDTKAEEQTLAALRNALDSKPDYMARDVASVDLTSHNSVAVSSSAFGMSGQTALAAQDIYQHHPSSFVKRGAHVLSNYTDEQLDSTLNVILRGDNSEAVFHYTGEDLKRLLFRKLTTMDQEIQRLASIVGFTNGRIDAIERYGNQ